MFERNIIDLVGLFIENVQSLYPFLGGLLWRGATGPRGRASILALTVAPLPAEGARAEAPAALTKGREGYPSVPN